ncbi:MAG: ABC transporter ATP-binding protein, partial [Oscillospiraceae bacterium]|nr:ABC transporter ATP-binding protein [Oscillospiraceae bacterium]
SILLAEALKGQGKFFLLGVVGVLCSVVISYITPIVTSFVIDFVLGGDRSSLPPFLNRLTADMSTEQLVKLLWAPALFLLALTLLNCVFSYLRGKYVSLASEGVTKSIRNRIYSHLMDLPYDYHKHVQTGDIVQRCTSDIDMIRRFIGMRLLELLRTVVLISASFIVIFNIHHTMAFLASMVVPLMFGLSFLFFSKIKKVFVACDEAEGRLSTFMQENFSGMRVVRAFGQQASEIERFRGLNDEYLSLYGKMIKVDSAFWGFSDALGFIQIQVTFISAILFCLSGAFSVGKVTLFLSYTNMMVWPARQLGRIIADLSKASISLGRLEEIMNEPTENEIGSCLTPAISGDIRFENVSFAYDDGGDVLSDVSFHVKAGQTVAILGATGSGKSSLVHLLQRLYRPTGGRILMDGVDINDIERHHLRRNIGIVLQEPFLYSRSIMENIRIVKPDATEEEVFAQARIASVHDVITSFESGYDTMVGERGVTLSGGQKQRVAIARMLMQQAPILVFDDSLSAVDTETDTKIRQALRSRRKGVTTFIISHRITTLCEADFILVLENGRITQQGTHDELLKQEGLYSRIAGIQTMGSDAQAAKGGKA